MELPLWVGAATIVAICLALASQTYQETVRAHDQAALWSKRGSIACVDGHIEIKNIDFSGDFKHPVFDLAHDPCAE